MIFLLCVALQFLLFIPFYFIYLNDCKEIGKENLAVSLEKRFVAWLAWCPIWALGLITLGV